VSSLLDARRDGVDLAVIQRDATERPIKELMESVPHVRATTVDCNPRTGTHPARRETVGHAFVVASDVVLIGVVECEIRVPSRSTDDGGYPVLTVRRDLVSLMTLLPEPTGAQRDAVLGDHVVLRDERESVPRLLYQDEVHLLVSRRCIANKIRWAVGLHTRRLGRRLGTRGGAHFLRRRSWGGRRRQGELGRAGGRAPEGKRRHEDCDASTHSLSLSLGVLARLWKWLWGESSAVGEREDEDDGTRNDSDVHVVAIEDTIDLHHFHPRDVPSVVDEYLLAAQEKGFRDVRVIHGKGKGVQRQRVQTILAKHPAVVAFQSDGLGSTRVTLREEWAAERTKP
jgi:hypothetical protein